MGKRSTLEAKIKHQLFAEAYVLCNDAQEAAIKVGYSPKGAKVTACRLLKEPHVKDYIAKKRKKQVTPILSKLEKERDDLIETLHELIKKAVAASEIKAAVSAIAELNKMRGNYAPVKSENTNYDGDKDLLHAKEVSDEAQIKLDQQHRREF